MVDRVLSELAGQGGSLILIIDDLHELISLGALTHPVQFRSSFTQISWICAAAFACAAVLAATFITGPRRPTPPPRPALIQTPLLHLTCPVAFRHARGPTRRPNSSQTSNPSL